MLDRIARMLPKEGAVPAAREPLNVWTAFGGWVLLALLAAVIVVGIVFAVKRKKGTAFSGRSGVDELTGLGNKYHARRYFNAIAHSPTDTVCLAYLAMDAALFEKTFDRERCDKLQKTVGELLSAFCGESDCAARIADGAFVVGITCRSGLTAQQRLGDLIDHLNQWQTAFVGKAVAPFCAGLFFDVAESGGFDASLRNATLAYRYARDSQMNLYVCTKELLKRESYCNYLQEKLSRAIDEKQFEMFLQFIYDPKAQKFTCAEVLSRWNNPLEGFLMPAYYINDMRNTGVIRKFDLYMLDKTCDQLEKWNGTPFADLRLSCNINRISVSAPGFAQGVQNILKKYKFDRSRLMLEITEDALIDKAAAYQNIVACKKEGIRIAIDDFCTGHSTLEDISDYPIDQIKLDRNMIVRTASKRGNVFLKELIEMAHRMDLEVVCEGVETEEQRDAVIESGCDLVQGYYYSYVFPLNEGEAHYQNFRVVDGVPVKV